MLGLAGNDALIGGRGKDTIDGGDGNDTMKGGKDDDLYVVESLADKVFENADEGADTVFTTLSSYTLGASVESLTFFDAAGATVGTGNVLANVLGGNNSANKLDGQAGNDTLNGFSGNDTLIGGAGNDTLDGGTGADTMIGGAGNDIYFVDDAGDLAQEAANGGIDRINVAIDITLSANIENAIVLAAGKSVSGNDANNVIAGSSGTDSISGGNGGDTLFGDAGADALFGDAGNDVIEGGQGADAMNGGAGNDLFFYELNSVADLPNLGGDLISGFEVGKDKIDLFDLFEDFDILTSDVIGSGHLSLEVSGGNTLLKFDSNGGGDGFVTLATLQGVTNATLADVIFPLPGVV